MGGIFDSTQKTEIPERTAQEQQIMDQLQDIGTRTGEAIDPQILQQLASGQLAGATDADRALVEQAIQASQEIAERAARSQYQEISQQVESGLLERGMEGSSIEAVNQAILGRQLQQQLADVSSRGQQFGSEALLNLPFQRAGVQLNANQQLLQQLLGTSGGVLQAGLQERLGQPSVTSSPGIGQVLGNFSAVAGQTAGMLATGGATPEVG